VRPRSDSDRHLRPCKERRITFLPLGRRRPAHSGAFSLRRFGGLESTLTKAPTPRRRHRILSLIQCRPLGHEYVPRRGRVQQKIAALMPLFRNILCCDAATGASLHYIWYPKSRSPSLSHYRARGQTGQRRLFPKRSRFACYLIPTNSGSSSRKSTP
jgi:hypothetical protein